MNCVQPGIQYFQEKFGNDLEKPLSIFKAARLFSPIRVHEIHPASSDLDQLDLFPFIKSSDLLALKSELASYLAKASQVNPEGNFDLLKWWNTHETELPCWSATFKKVLLIQPSSAASERVFSLLNNSFNHSQQKCLEDYIEASIMLQYNSR